MHAQCAQAGACHYSVFGLPAVQAVLQFKWDRFGRKALLAELACFVTWLVSFSVFLLIWQVGGLGVCVCLCMCARVRALFGHSRLLVHLPVHLPTATKAHPYRTSPTLNPNPPTPTPNPSPQPSTLNPTPQPQPSPTPPPQSNRMRTPPPPCPSSCGQSAGRSRSGRSSSRWRRWRPSSCWSGPRCPRTRVRGAWGG